MKLSEKIRTLRKQKGWSQEDLGFKLEKINENGISRQAISDWENDKYEPKLDNIRDLANVFGVSFDFLLNEDLTFDNCDPKGAIKEEPKKETTEPVKEVEKTEDAKPSEEPTESIQEEKDPIVVVPVEDVVELVKETVKNSSNENAAKVSNTKNEPIIVDPTVHFTIYKMNPLAHFLFWGIVLALCLGAGIFYLSINTAGLNEWAYLGFVVVLILLCVSCLKIISGLSSLRNGVGKKCMTVYQNKVVIYKYRKNKATLYNKDIKSVTVEYKKSKLIGSVRFKTTANDVVVKNVLHPHVFVYKYNQINIIK